MTSWGKFATNSLAYASMAMIAFITTDTYLLILYMI